MKKLFMCLLGTALIIGLSACMKEVEPTPEPVETPSVEETVDRFGYSGELTEPIIVDSEKEVEITLTDVSMKLEDFCIKIENAKAATIILVGDNKLESTGDVETIEPKVISSDVDLTFKGDGSLTINSTDTCIKSKTNLTVESGIFNLIAGDDGDGLRANETLTINEGSFNIRAGECLEATVIEINGGNFNLSATDDAINASEKSETGLTPAITFNDGTVMIVMDQGDTDAIDSNGDIIINGGHIDISAQSGFDWDGDLTFNNGTVILNGEVVTEIQNQFGEMGMGHGFEDNRPEDIFVIQDMQPPHDGNELPMGEDSHPEKPGN